METLFYAAPDYRIEQPSWNLPPDVPPVPISRAHAQISPWSPGPELKEIAASDFGMITELILLFLEDASSRIAASRTLCISRDFERVRKQAHTLKGSALQMGAKELASSCASLENSGPISHLECMSMIETISDEYLAVRSAMQAYLADASVARC